MIILASKSPRRKELLEMIGIDFKIVESNFDEHSISSDNIERLPLLEATSKAEVVAKSYPNDIVIGADTGVFIDGLMLGKPTDRDDAIRMLKLLSGKTHKVITGVCVIKDNKHYTINSISEVTFYELDEQTINSYADSKEPYDKAGAYAIQGLGATLIKGIKGDYFTIMGLPVAELNRLLNKIK